MLKDFIQFLFSLPVCFVSLALFVSEYVLDLREYIRPPVISCNEFMSLTIAQVSCQFVIMVVLNYLFSESSYIQNICLFYIILHVFQFSLLLISLFDLKTICSSLSLFLDHSWVISTEYLPFSQQVLACKCQIRNMPRRRNYLWENCKRYQKSIGTLTNTCECKF